MRTARGSPYAAPCRTSISIRVCSNSVQASDTMAAAVESSAKSAPKTLRAASSAAIRTRIAAVAMPAISATMIAHAAALFAGVIRRASASRSPYSRFVAVV